MMAKKLRSACDFCHQTKVKCSGGNPCNGCAQLSIECVYSASNRIGRPKGSRNKKTIERVKRYKAENESRQRAQQAENEAANAGRLSSPENSSPATAAASSNCSSTPSSSSSSTSTTTAPSPANTSSSTVPSSTMTVDWTGSSVGQKLEQVEDGSDLFAFPCEPGSAVSSVDPVYSMYTGEMAHDLADFDFSHSPSDHPTTDQQLALPIFHDAEGGSTYNPFLGSNDLKGLSEIDASGSVAASVFSVADQSRPISDATTHNPSTPFTSPHPTPALSSSSTVSSSTSLSCTCLQDQASMLSRLASTSLNSVSLDLDAALECAMQATRTWDIFLRCRQCAYRLFESKFDSYLVLTSGMKIVLNILNDQLQSFESIGADRLADGAELNRRSSVSHMNKHWRIGGYETNGKESQLLSVTLLSNIAITVVTLSSKLCEITSDKNKDAFLLDFPATTAADGAEAIITKTTTPTTTDLVESPQKDGAERSYLMDHDMDETAAGFNLKFLHHKACSIDRSAKRFKEEITARARQMIQ